MLNYFRCFIFQLDLLTFTSGAKYLGEGSEMLLSLHKVTVLHYNPDYKQTVSIRAVMGFDLYVY